MRSYNHGRKKCLAAAVGAALLAGAFSIVPRAEANPVLDAKDAAVSISGLNTANMTITSGAQNNLIKWVDFSIASGETVNFNDAHNYLNYVTGSARSDILGTLTGKAGGHIWLVNPNGILIGDGATVNVGNLHLSTRTLTESQLNDFAANGTNPLTSGAIGGDVINMGNLNATSISVEGKNITFKNVADVKNFAGTAALGGTNVKLTATGGEIHIGSATGSFSGYTTTGDTYNYKLVNNATELQKMKDKLDGNYMLAGDIEMNGVTGFTPIGYCIYNVNTGEEKDTYAFRGRFDGLGYAVKNITIDVAYGAPDGSGDRQCGIGLFGYSKGTVENLKLSGGSIESTDRSVGIIGQNAGAVRNVFNDGVTVKGDIFVGGIVGENTGTVRNVWNKGNISGHETVGGIVGFNQYTGEGAAIENAWNEGNITGQTGGINTPHNIGGILGWNANRGGTIQNVYNTGKVESAAGRTIGGIVGCNDGSNNNTIQYAYNTGSVTGNYRVGGIVGSNFGTLKNAYSQEGTAANVCGEIGTYASVNDTAIKSEADMKKAATFTGFDFSEGGAWRIYEGQTMPLLTAFLTRADNITSTTEYNGSADAGATYAATTYNGVQTQSGYNFIKDVSIVTPKNLTVSFGSKTYDGTTTAAASAAALTGIVGSDDVSLQVDSPTAAYADKNVGTGKAVTFTGLSLTGAKAANYNLAAGTGDITQANVTISVNDYTKTYDGTTDASGATLKTVAGQIFAGDSISGGTKTFDTAEVGTGKTVTVSGVIISDGNNGGNYNVTYQANTNSEIKAVSKPTTPTTDPATVIENIIDNKEAAKEYTNTVASLNSDAANTFQPMSAGSLPPVVSETQTQNAAPTTGTAGEMNGAPTQEKSEGETRQPNENPAPQQSAGVVTIMAEGRLAMQGEGVNTPVSMDVDVLAASLSGNAPNPAPHGTATGTQTGALNGTMNGASNDMPTGAQTNTPTEQASTPGAAQEDEE